MRKDLIFNFSDTVVKVFGDVGYNVVFHSNKIEVDKKKKIVYLPSVPDNVEDGYLKLLRGFTDHEVAHILFTELDTVKIPEDMSDDPKVREIASEVLNALEDGRVNACIADSFVGSKINIEHLSNTVISDLEKKGKDVGFNALMIGLYWLCYDYEKAKGFFEKAGVFYKAVSDLIEEARGVKSATEVREVAVKMAKRLKDLVRDGGSGEKSGKKRERGESDNGKGGSGGSEGSGEIDDFDEFDSDEGDDKEDEKKEKKINEDIDGFSKAFEKLNKKMSEKLNKDYLAQPYHPYTGFDEVKYVRGSLKAISYFEICEKVQIVNVLRKKLLRKFMGYGMKETRYLESGKLDSRCLVQAYLGSKRVFESRVRRKKQSIAVSLLVDQSGSMNGEKIRLAADTAIILAETFDLLKVPFEILGFTAQWSLESKHFRNSHMEYNRVIPLKHYIYKRFNDKFRYNAGNLKLLYRAYIENTDGESVLWAAKRLALRKEKNKFLFVMSDGEPCNSDTFDNILKVHLKDVVKKIVMAGIYVVGIGIAIGRVKDYYPHYIVVNSVEQLPYKVYNVMCKVVGGL